MLFGLAPLRSKWLSNSIEVSQALRSSLMYETREDIVVSILIDHSGSMRGRSIAFTAAAVDFVQDFLLHMGCKVEVLGFTTTSWKGGLSRCRWISDGKPFNPGRLCDLLHIVYRSADDTRKSSIAMPLQNMLRPDLLKENVDGEAIEWAVSRLNSRPEEQKFLLVISDGAPVDDSTLSVNDKAYLWDHLKTTIASVRAKDAVALMAVGIGYSVENLYFNSAKVDELETLAEVILDLLRRTMQHRIPGQVVDAPRQAEKNDWLKGRWKKTSSETNEAYIRRLREFGDTPAEIIKALRMNTGISLDLAHNLVVSESELEIFLKANKDRGVGERGMVRLLNRVYGCTNKAAKTHVARSGLWDDAVLSAPVGPSSADS